MGKQTKLVIGVAMAIVVGVLIYFQVKDWHKKNIDEIIVREKVAYEKETKKLEQQVVQLRVLALGGGLLLVRVAVTVAVLVAVVGVRLDVHPVQHGSGQAGRHLAQRVDRPLQP